MSKTIWKPGTMVYPAPAVMVSCGDAVENFNIITIAWTGTINSKPPMCYISIRPERHSYDIIKRTGEFVINLTTKDLAEETDWAGVRSGRDYNKFEELNLTPAKASIVNAPIIEEAPLHIECKVKDIIKLGSHDMFIAEVVAVLADDRYIDEKSGEFRLDKSGLMAYSHGKYYEIGKMIGKFGFAVKNTKRIKNKKKLDI
jgi:flavin reductase (DIM6/NTAB) family NADH-FMN oxidoreductase RutF